MPGKLMLTRTLLCLCAILAVTSQAVSEPAVFLAAKSVWVEGRETDMNLFAGFRAVIEQPAFGHVTLRSTGSTIYRVFLNGEFLGYGPARGPHGWFRVDEWDLTPLLREGKNVVAFQVAGYNVNSYYLLDQPSFLQAEIESDGRVLAATGHAERPFGAVVLEERVQKVQRYSFQRPFMEVYRLTPKHDDWLRDPDAPFETAPLAVQPDVRLLPRRVSLPDFHLAPAQRRITTGKVEQSVPNEQVWKDRSLVNINEKLKGCPEAQLETVPSTEMQYIAVRSTTPAEEVIDEKSRFELAQNEFQIFDLGRNVTGFLQLKVKCDAPTRIFVSFDEMLQNGQVNWRRLGCVNIVSYTLAPGEYTLESFEPYTLRYLQVMALEGACTVSGIGLRSYENPDMAAAQFHASDERLNQLFDAGRATCAQNTLDVFMDCPHRERAGWLCDSFFTSRSAMTLSGETSVEQNFFENFLLPDEFKFLPTGMLPMCYPADHNDGIFIPNWALWFVVQLGEYRDRTGDTATVEGLRPKVFALFDYFKKFENSDGLLEKLESWVFVEWSKANQFVQDVNYPSNMLYTAALETASRLYGVPELTEKARTLQETIRRQSYDGQFFVDNALRKDNTLERTTNRSEVCQYFAFFFHVATPESHPELWRILREEFGPKRKDTQAWPEIHPANAFVGNMLRLELLSRHGFSQQILDESIDYLLYMASRTGTLWENIDESASLNHGFASHIVHTLLRDVLGMRHVDAVNHRIDIVFPEVVLPSCSGVLPLPGGATLALSWRQEGDTLYYSLDIPPGYTLQLRNSSGKNLQEQ